MRIILFFLIFALAPLPALADLPLRYKEKVNDARGAEAVAMLEKAGKFVPNLPYQIAATDLNFDGVDEWVFRQDREKGCEAAASCTYLIVGLSEGKPVLIGDIRARKIGIADEKQYGVRRLYVYNQKNDDFAYQTYVWTPEMGAFLPQQ